ncbi:hypothetical protein N0V82_002157 [Gnomoniopsis sp. IMI 355080]|nr:hypothetical protein N0V82_002157 [Gnomoniopsis sp. IMI 355080]
MKTTIGSHHGSISRIPEDHPPITTNVKRVVQIGYRPIGGRAAAWTIGVLNELLKRLGNMGIRIDDQGPNPHHHWCVIVGDFYHHAQITNGLMWYENEEVSWGDGWSLFDVGETTFNDAAIAKAGELSAFLTHDHLASTKADVYMYTKALRGLHDMPEAYDLWSNNCHHFALRLIDTICSSGYRTFSKSKRYHRKSSSMHRVDEENVRES